MHLKGELDLSSSYVDSVPLATNSSSSAAGTQCVVAGWGVTRVDSDDPSDDLMYLYMPILEDQYCFTRYPATFKSAKMLCAGFEEGEQNHVLVSPSFSS